MPLHRSTTPLLVYTPTTFVQMMDHLQARKLVALDTESDSLFSYYPKVCLIQISVYTDPAVDDQAVTDYLVDPLRFHALEPLGALLQDPGCEVIIHAAENDIYLLQREFNFNVANLFDTQLAARILGWERAGLAAILEHQFGVVSDKRMQRTNWGKRPLTPEQIAYAQMDTHYLLELRARQMDELQARNRWEEAQEAFMQLARIDYRARAAAERTVFQMKETRSVPLERLGMLDALWQWREAEAQRQDRPPFKIVGNQALIELAEQQPATSGQLLQVAALSRGEMDRYGGAILQAVREGKTRPRPDLPERSQRLEEWLEPDVLNRFDALRRWRSKTADARGVAPEIVFPNDVLLEVAKRRPTTLESLQEIAAIGPWKAKTYGPELIQIVVK
jgi:ribonuclease D